MALPRLIEISVEDVALILEVFKDYISIDVPHTRATAMVTLAEKMEDRVKTRLGYNG